MIILKNKEIDKKIYRLVHQINEIFSGNQDVIMVGIEKTGFILSEKISDTINKKFNLNYKSFKLSINKKSMEIKNDDFSLNEVKGKNVILVDDVLLSGKTMMYSIRHILYFEPETIKTLVLINRSYKKFPITANFEGISISTNLNDNIDVVFENNEFNAYLN